MLPETGPIRARARIRLPEVGPVSAGGGAGMSQAAGTRAALT